MSMMFCFHCDSAVDTDFDNGFDHDFDSKEFKCCYCVERDYDPTPEEVGEPPITMAERQVDPR